MVTGSEVMGPSGWPSSCSKSSRAVLMMTGSGWGMDATVQWSKDIFKKGERVEATLTPVPQYGTLVVSNPGTGGAYRFSSVTGDPLPAGYYLLTLQLFVNDVLQKTMVEAVRILSGQTTSGTLTFTF